MREPRPPEPERAGRVLRTVTVLAVLALGVSLVVAVDVGRGLARQDSCPLPALVFDVESAETVDTSWFPPSATCAYRMADRTEVGTESRWGVYLPVVPALVLAAALLGTRRRTRRYVVRPTGHETPVPPTPQ